MPGCFRHSGRSRSASRSPCRQWQVRSDSSADGFTTPRALHVFNPSAYIPSDAMPLAVGHWAGSARCRPVVPRSAARAVDASAAPRLAPPKQHVLCQVCGNLAAADHGLPGQSQTLPDVASVGHRSRESIAHALGNEWMRASLPLPAALPHSISGDAATGPPALWSGLEARETAWPGTLMPWCQGSAAFPGAGIVWRWPVVQAEQFRPAFRGGLDREHAFRNIVGRPVAAHWAATRVRMEFRSGVGNTCAGPCRRQAVHRRARIARISGADAPCGGRSPEFVPWTWGCQPWNRDFVSGGEAEGSGDGFLAMCSAPCARDGGYDIDHDVGTPFSSVFAVCDQTR